MLGEEKKNRIMACCKMLHILWPFQTAPQLLEFAFHPSLPRNPGGKGRTETGKAPRGFQRWDSPSKGETAKAAKC